MVQRQLQSLSLEDIKNEIYDCMSRGYTLAQIVSNLRAKSIFLSQSTVKKHMAVIKSEISSIRKQKMSEVLDTELHIVSSIRTKALDSFEASKTDAVTMRQQVEQKNNVVPVNPINDGLEGNLTLINGLGNLQPVTQTTTTTSSPRDGDAKLLRVALDATDTLHKMLKLDINTVKAEETAEKNKGYTDEQLREMDTAQLARLINEQIQAK